MTQKIPALVDVDWLSRHRSDPDVRVFDTTVLLSPDPNGPGTVAESGRAAFDESHIPGSGFLDLLTDLSDPRSSLRFMLPPAERFASALGAAGVGDNSTVVLYDRRMNMWSARLWWMLRAFSFQGHAAVLDGGWRAWRAAGAPTSTEPCRYPPATVTSVHRPGVFTDRYEVLAGNACIVNALTAAQHRGEDGAAHYGRPGRIAGSVNVGYDRLLDPNTGCLLPPDGLRAAFEAGGVAAGSGRIITYCGGGIAASLDAFALSLLGHDDVAVYDASLMEWTADHALPMETG